MNTPKFNSTHQHPLVRFAAFIVGPLFVFVSVLLLWQWLVTAREIPKFILPSPWQIIESAVENRQRLQAASIRTIGEAAGGLVVSSLLGFLIASVLSQSSLVRRSLLPYAIVFQTIPIIGVAPLLITWFGNTFGTVVLIAAFISIFPVISNTTTGLISVDHAHLDLFRLNQANRWQVFWKLQVPTSMPLAVAGIKISSAACVLGACVGDYFVGSAQQEGLGFLIFQAKDRDTGMMFATLFVLTVIGLVFFSVTSLLCQVLLLGWQERKLANR